MVHYRGWEAEGRLNPLLGLFGSAMGSRSASYMPNHTWVALEMSPYRWGKVHIHAFHVAPSMGPIVSVMNLQGRKNSL